MAVAALILYLAMILVVFVLRTVVQKRRTGDSGIRAGGLTSSFGSLEWLAGWLLVLALLAGLLAPIVEILGVDPLTTSPWWRTGGLALAGAGIAFTFLAQMSMGADWRIGIDTGEATGLVTEGAFTVVRNPIFSAMMIAAAGLALAVPNLVSIAGFATIVIAIELQVRFVEEPHLRRAHASDYATYEARVGRFVPTVGRAKPVGRTAPPST